MDIDISTIIQGGAVGISVMLIIALVYIVKMFSKVLGNHINHNTKALTELTETNRGVKDVLKDLCNKL